MLDYFKSPSISQHIVTICLKLGTKSCSIAYLFRSQFHTDPTRVLLFTFWGKNLAAEFPPSLLIDDYEEVFFGHQATEKCLENGGSGIYIENVFKDILTVEDLQIDSLIIDSKGNDQNASKIINAFLLAIRRFIMNHFNKQHALIRQDEMLFVISIPSVRAETVRTFLNEAWRMDYPGQDVMIVTYPEATLTSYIHELIENPSESRLYDLEVGERVMVIGFEDELDSYNTYEKRSSMNYKQETQFLSGGSSKELIMREFDNFFADLFGSWVWNIGRNKDIWIGIEDKINFLLENGCANHKNILFTDQFILLDEVCKKHTNMPLKHIISISDYAGHITLNGFRLRIDTSLILSIFDKGIRKVMRNINHVMSLEEKNIKFILLSGNVANFPLVRDAIVQMFPQSHVLGGKGSRSSYEALKGGTQFGHKPVVFSTMFSCAQTFVPQ